MSGLQERDLLHRRGAPGTGSNHRQSGAPSSVSGVVKNAIAYCEMSACAAPPYLTDALVGLIATSILVGGRQDSPGDVENRACTPRLVEAFELSDRLPRWPVCDSAYYDPRVECQLLPRRSGDVIPLAGIGDAERASRRQTQSALHPDARDSSVCGRSSYLPIERADAGAKFCERGLHYAFSRRH